MKNFNLFVLAIAFLFSVSLSSCGAQATTTEEVKADTTKVEGKCGEGKCGENKCGGDKKVAIDSLAQTDSTEVTVADSTTVK